MGIQFHMNYMYYTMHKIAEYVLIFDCYFFIKTNVSNLEKKNPISDLIENWKKYEFTYSLFLACGMCMQVHSPLRVCVEAGGWYVMSPPSPLPILDTGSFNEPEP